MALAGCMGYEYGLHLAGRWFLTLLGASMGSVPWAFASFGKPQGQVLEMSLPRQKEHIYWELVLNDFFEKKEQSF